MNRKLVVGLLVGLVAVIVAWSFVSSGLSPDQRGEGKDQTAGQAAGPGGEARPLAGFAAPDFQLVDLTGQSTRLSELRGQPVFLNFWATWCPPCREEMPTIQEAYKKNGQKVRFLAVNLTDTEKSVEEVRQFLAAGGYTFPVLLDTEERVAETYQVRGIPTSFFIDSQGIVRLRYEGPLDKDRINQALREIL